MKLQCIYHQNSVRSSFADVEPRESYISVVYAPRHSLGSDHITQPSTWTVKADQLQLEARAIR